MSPYLKGRELSELKFIHEKYGHRSKRLLNSKLGKLQHKEDFIKSKQLKKLTRQTELRRWGFTQAKQSKTFLKQIQPKKKKIFKKICGHEFCDIEFKTTNPRQKYCSDFCRILANGFNYCICGYPKTKQAKFCRKCNDKRNPKKRDSKSGHFLKNIPIKAGRKNKG